MDRFESDLINCCNYIDSKKLQDRKKYMTDLKEILQNENVIHFLKTAKRDNKRVNWDTLFESAHRGVVLTADKVYDDICSRGKPVTTTSNLMSTAHSLIHDIVNRGNENLNEPLILCKLIIPAFLQILGDQKLFNQCFQTYLNLLEKNVLPVRRYWGEITCDQWNGLLSSIMKLLKLENLDDRTRMLLLSNLNLVILHGSEQSNIGLKLRRLFPLVSQEIKGCSKKFNSYRSVVMGLTLSLCELVEKENRVAICQLGEDIISELLSFEYKDSAQPGSAKKYGSLLLRFVWSHHPGGGRSPEEGAIAISWRQWNDFLVNIYYNLLSRCNFTPHGSFNENDFLPSEIIDLMVRVSYQILHQSFESGDQIALSPVASTSVLNDSNFFFASGPSTKKRKLSLGFSSLLDDLQDAKRPTFLWCRLSLIGSLLIQHPELMTVTDFFNYLTYVSDKLKTSSDETLVVKHLCKCAIGLIKVEDTLSLTPDTDEQRSVLWLSIWESCLRLIGLNVCEEGVHALVQRLLTRQSDSHQLNAVLDMYIAGTIKLSITSANTFMLLRERTNFTGGVKSREGLVENILQLSKFQTKLSNYFEPHLMREEVFKQSDIIANFILYLLLESKLPPSKAIKEFCSLNHVFTGSSNEFFDCELFYLKCSFELHPESISQLRSDNKINNECKTLLLENKEIFSFIYNKLLNVVALAIEAVSDPNAEAHSSLKALINAIKLCALLFRLNELYGLYFCNPSKDVDNAQEFSVLLRQILPSVWEKVDQTLVTANFVNVLYPVECLLQVISLCPKTAEKVISVKNDKLNTINKQLFAVFTKRPVSVKEDIDDFDFFYGPGDGQRMSDIQAQKQMTTIDEQCVISSVLVLISKLNSTANERANAFSILLQFIRSHANTSMILSFKMICEIVEAYLQETSLTESSIKDILSAIRYLCEHWHKHCEQLTTCLELLTVLAAQVYTSTVDIQERYLTLINGLKRMIWKDQYGPKVVCKFIKLAATIVQVDNQYKWTVESKKGDRSKEPFAIILLGFLDSPFHEVRMSAVECIQCVFNNSLSCATVIQTAAFDKLILSLNESFKVDENIEQSDILDEKLNRTSFALNSLIAVVSRSSFWRRKALYLLLKLFKFRNVKSGTSAKVVSYLSKLCNTSFSTLIEQNLDFIVCSWYSDYRSFKEFPKSFIQTFNNEEFFNQYVNECASTLLRSNDCDGFKAFCDDIACSEADVIKKSFASIFASHLPRLSDSSLQAGVLKAHSYIEQTIGAETLKELLSNELDKIIILMFRKLHDPDYMTTLCEDENNLVFPLKSSSNILFSTVSLTLKYLQKTSPDTSMPLLVFLGQNMHKFVVNIILTLYGHLYNSCSEELRMACFLQFISFCDELGKSLIDLGQMKSYVIRQVIHCLLNVSSFKQLTSVSLKYLLRFLELSLYDCSLVINDLLKFAVPVIVSRAKSAGTAGETVVKILDLLISRKSLLTNLSLLDPLPDDPIFVETRIGFDELAQVNVDLEAKINHFLEAGKGNVDPSSRIQGLKNLKKQLSTHKNDLSTMYSDLSLTRGFSEDCSKSLIHNLISTLISLTSSTNSAVRELAAQCLGEMGPRDLCSYTLKPEPTQDHPALALKLYELLAPLMVDQHPVLCEASVKVLSSIFSTRDGTRIRGLLSQEELDFLYPILSKGTHEFKCSVDETRLLENIGSFWPLDTFIQFKHEEWIVDLVCGLLNCFEQKLFRGLQPIIKLKYLVGEQLLPYLLYEILVTSEQCAYAVQKRLKQYFEKHFESWQFQSAGHSIGESIYMNRASVKCMLNVVNFIRLRENSKGQKYLIEGCSLSDVNYLHAAKAAQYCSAYFTSILYAELWVEAVKQNMTPDPLSPSISFLDSLYENQMKEGEILQKVLWEAYQQIGEDDAVQGCGQASLSHFNSRIKYYDQMKQFGRVVETCEILGDSYQTDLVQAFRNSGLFNTALLIRANDYDSAWRLGNWSIEPSVSDKNFESFHYAALKAAAHSDFLVASDKISSARSVVIQSLAHSSLQVANSVYSPLCQLQLLSELEEYCQTKNINPIDTSVMMRWEDYEPILSQRGILSASKNSRESSHMWLDIARQASKYRASVVAQRCLANVTCLNIDDSIKDQLDLEFAQLSWQAKDFQLAKYSLRSLIHKLNQTEGNPLLPSALITYGTWMVETKSDNPHNIIHKYFEKAASLSKNNKQEQLAAAKRLARFVDSEYQRLTLYTNSNEYHSKLQYLDVLKANRDKWAAKKNEGIALTRDENVSYKTVLQQAEIDQNEIDSINKEMQGYLEMALKQYMVCLKCGVGDENDLKMFRLVSLWLNNAGNKEVNTIVADNIFLIPSYKILPVLPQLVVRMSDEDNTFYYLLKQVVERCCIDHPHHAIPYILALVNSDKDAEITLSQSSKKKRQSVNAVEARVRASRNLLNQLLKHSKIGTLVRDMSTLSEAYISLAYLAPSHKIGDGKIPNSEPIRKLPNMSHVACLTLNQPVSKIGDYSNIIGIVKFPEIMTLIGGVNQPKKITCICTDGVKRAQLVKGRDDLRQDAVMQQVFSIMNLILQSSEDTARRKLNIRCYKVVPLSRTSGVIQWCSNTEPVASYLTGLSTNRESGGAHKKFRPSDMSCSEARKKMQEAAKGSVQERLEVYLKICRRFQPVFRFFFFERFPTAGEWFERRLAYTRSVAINSMVGYILGIGDRHVANILIDQVTAEVIHIDFGIAFEQGKILPTPETVPFRLTRDIQDGMGVSGVEGVFRRCCEETIKAFRKSQEPILTALEVLLYDPLYIWALSPEKAHTLQGEVYDSNSSTSSHCSSEVNVVAERALNRLKQKLQGTEAGGYGSNNVESQVNRLIEEARDPANLCRLFAGWQPYL